MRLGQLSRKLDVSTTKIVSFIKVKFETTVENHPNTKIEDDFVATIEANFKKAETPKPLEKKALNKEQVTPPEKAKEESEMVNNQPEVEKTKEKTKQTEENIEASKIDTSVELEVPTNMDDVELIKAPKPKLKEIKILRKIELPNMKKNEESSKTDETSEEKPSITAKDVDQLEKELKESIEKPTPVKKKSTYKRPNKPMKKTKSVDEILAEKRRKEEKKRKEEEKREKQQKEYEKKIKKEYYAAQAEKIKQKKKKKKKKKKTITKVETTKIKNNQDENKPKSWIGRLIHWFQTED